MGKQALALFFSIVFLISCIIPSEQKQSNDSMLPEAPNNEKIIDEQIKNGQNTSSENIQENKELLKGNADVLFVRAHDDGNSWTFSVTVVHADKGWVDYADGWDVVLADGTVILPPGQSTFTRLLTHPHEYNVPFTRDQSGIVIPEGITQVMVRAHDLVDGYGGKEVTVDLTQKSGKDFEVS